VFVNWVFPVVIAAAAQESLYNPGERVYSCVATALMSSREIATLIVRRIADALLNLTVN